MKTHFEKNRNFVFMSYGSYHQSCMRNIYKTVLIYHQDLPVQQILNKSSCLGCIALHIRQITNVIPKTVYIRICRKVKWTKKFILWIDSSVEMVKKKKISTTSGRIRYERDIYIFCKEPELLSLPSMYVLK